MNRRQLRQWGPVLLSVLTTAAILVFGFIPSHRRARDSVRAARELEAALQRNMATLQALPIRLQQLDSLAASLRTFRGALRRTDEVDLVMRDLMDRGRHEDVSFWIVNPSVPVLVTLEEMPDSLARLDLALLPVVFECRGDFLRVGRFLETEQARSEFCQWQHLALTVDPRTREVRATGELVLFLLPERTATERDA